MRSILQLFIYSVLFTSYSFMLQSQSQVGSDLLGLELGDSYGTSIAFSDDGDRLVIGANAAGNPANKSGYVTIHERKGNEWEQMGNVINGEQIGDRFGQAVDISGDGEVVVVGGPFNAGLTSGDRGHVRVYSWIDQEWIQKGNDIHDMGARFGHSVSISRDGSRIAAGAIFSGNNGINTGRVRVFEFQDNEWTQLGTEIEGIHEMGISGWSIDLSDLGDRIAIGAPKVDVPLSNTGEIRIYHLQNTTWTQIGNSISGYNINDQVGFSVKLSGDGTRVVSGCPFADEERVRVFEYMNNQWQNLGRITTDDAAGTFEGWSVSISGDGNRVIAGAPLNREHPIHLYNYNEEIWSNSNLNLGESEIGALAGEYVSIASNGEVIAFGESKTDAGIVRIFDLDIVSSLEQINRVTDIVVFPNPTAQSITLQSPTAIERINILDVTGRKIDFIISEFERIDVSNMAEGIYFFQVYFENGEQLSKKIVVNRFNR